MKIFFWVTDLLIPLTMIAVGYMLYKNPLKDMNSGLGYRTKRAIKSIETWRYANTLCGEYWMKVGIVLFIFIVFNKILIPVRPEYLSIINMGVEVISLMIPMFLIERKLKEKFYN
ncbi:SdpI family protein [Clostridium sp. Ade.TY]|uniref:SdpI family protein n=1 Tax=Clostridium sp. Ade.TY TaxID=1391647 RepID=UPI0004175627|nr:SdpI family protein [Clostridium sp. Ade.TY]